MHRYKYERMSSAELSAALDDLNMTEGNGVRLTGVSRSTFKKWLDPKWGPKDGGDIPVTVGVLFHVFLTVPGALDAARRYINQHIIEDRETERGDPHHGKRIE